ncbi:MULTISPECIES: SLAP domain-containing protein [unclassified Lactobacillus]|uniref:SLAP domain-containing protein n=1 Tax=unclassified Lactobacillus TaxID=2620435 RepID=UPI002B40F8C5|nr:MULTISPECIES: SLAP domain-containing protein [unclassified Lactobacillus]MCX8720292.1 SLAP domain-containing protein [Lactobacillus sp. B4010]MCX8732889.1 SLAP domain-containing protein [Lactobacillus sp. B4015]MCX8735058.1 SLAP domain-containing protein [Lactobacillus sp. B4012]
MKKNLRIVSAAAAALLAVAPVAATSVSTVFAEQVNTIGGGTTNNANVATFDLKTTNALSLSDGTAASNLSLDITATVTPDKSTMEHSQAKVYKASDFTDSNPSIANDGKINWANNQEPASLTNLYHKDDAGHENVYYAVVYVTLHGLQAGQKYTINYGNNQSFTITANQNKDAYFPVISNSFKIPDTSVQGAPFVTEGTSGTKALSSGSVSLTSSNCNVQDLAKAITTNYSVKTTGSSDLKGGWVNAESDVRAALKNAGITPKADAKGSFDKPAAPFPITMNIYSENGVKGTFLVIADPNSEIGDMSYPRISYKTKNGTVNTPDVADATSTASASRTIDDIDDVIDYDNSTATPITFNYVPVNGTVDTAAIKRAFHAVVSGNNTSVTLDTNVDVSKVNTKVAGRYPVVVSATNAEKKTSKVTFYITVGVKGATYKTVQSDGDVPVYKIEGNTVTDTKTTVKNGDQIAVFGDAIKVGDKSYTRINSADSNLYVETKYVDGSFKPADKTSKTVMHNAYIYDKDHKRVGTNMLRAYTKVDVLGAATKLADGSLVYQIGDNQYVMADNIDGTVRTLSHNAYVYKTSKKRADSRVLRKGAKVTTYGSPYTFKNGKAYYRIGGPSKQYVKVANFN